MLQCYSITMLQCYPPLTPTAAMPHFHLPPTHHGKDLRDGMSSTLSSDQ